MGATNIYSSKILNFFKSRRFYLRVIRETRHIFRETHLPPCKPAVAGRMRRFRPAVPSAIQQTAKIKKLDFTPPINNH